uniref:Uncharacterized protein n=1 Tax=Oryza rufipogon TaxID=4529 RepID=A0A0E0P1S3_ORYRU
MDLAGAMAWPGGHTKGEKGLKGNNASSYDNLNFARILQQIVQDAEAGNLGETRHGAMDYMGSEAEVKNSQSRKVTAGPDDGDKQSDKPRLARKRACVHALHACMANANGCIDRWTE